MVCLFLSLLLRSAAKHAAHWSLVLLHVAALILAHIVVVALLLVIVHGSVIVGACHTSPMRGPVQLKVSILMAGYLLAIQRLKDIPCNLIVLKLNKAIPNRLVGLLILNKLNIDDLSNPVKLHGNILLSHIGQHIANPQRLALLLILLRCCLHSPRVHYVSARPALALLAWSLCAVLHFFNCLCY